MNVHIKLFQFVLQRSGVGIVGETSAAESGQRAPLA
jgi:hypothetical protein